MGSHSETHRDAGGDWMEPSVRVDVGLIQSCVNKYTSTNTSTVTCDVGALIESVFLRDISAVRDDNEMLIKCVIF